MVIVDTDIFLLAMAFQRDPRYAVNAVFLDRAQEANPAITIYNLMEILGQLSFNLSPAQLDAWSSWLVEAYQLTVIWPVNPDGQASCDFQAEIFERPFARMRAHRMAFMDALILSLAERTPDVECFVTWNARHFKGKSSLVVLTPEEYLNQVS